MLTELTPATARRSLHTLESLGYVGRSGRRFLLRPKVLAIGTGYLSAINAEVVLQPFLQDVVNELGGSSSVTVLDDVDIVYIAHASLNRAIRLTAGAGSRYPVYPTSMGRVLLAFQPATAIDAYFERASIRKLTEHTETNPMTLRRILKDVRVERLRGDPGRARLRHRVGVAADLRTAWTDRRCRQLLGCDQPAGSRHDDQEASAGPSAGRAPHRGDADATPRADQLGRVRGVRLRAHARRRSRRSAGAAQDRAPRRTWAARAARGPYLKCHAAGHAAALR